MCWQAAFGGDVFFIYKFILMSLSWPILNGPPSMFDAWLLF